MTVTCVCVVIRFPAVVTKESLAGDFFCFDRSRIMLARNVFPPPPHTHPPPLPQPYARHACPVVTLSRSCIDKHFQHVRGVLPLGICGGQSSCKNSCGMVDTREVCGIFGPHPRCQASYPRATWRDVPCPESGTAILKGRRIKETMQFLALPNNCRHLCSLLSSAHNTKSVSAMSAKQHEATRSPPVIFPTTLNFTLQPPPP